MRAPRALWWVQAASSGGHSCTMPFLRHSGKGKAIGERFCQDLDRGTFLLHGRQWGCPASRLWWVQDTGICQNSRGCIPERVGFTVCTFKAAYFWSSKFSKLILSLLLHTWPLSIEVPRLSHRGRGNASQLCLQDITRWLDTWCGARTYTMEIGKYYKSRFVLLSV